MPPSSPTGLATDQPVRTSSVWWASVVRERICQATRIRWGQTASYGQVAHLVGRPKASRAVGAANGANPIPIIIPCHRVIGANGSLTGYGGGLENKRWLLAHEGVLRVEPCQIKLFRSRGHDPRA